VEWLCHLGATKAFSALGQYCHSPAVPPSQRSLETAPQSHHSASPRETAASKSEAELFFRFLLPLKPSWVSQSKAGRSFPRKQQGGGWPHGHTGGLGGGGAGAWHPTPAPVHRAAVPVRGPKQDPQSSSGQLSMGLEPGPPAVPWLGSVPPAPPSPPSALHPPALGPQCPTSTKESPPCS